jgi:anti-anti-sigma regulatory factor
MAALPVPVQIVTTGTIRVERESIGLVLWLRGEVDARVIAGFQVQWAGSPPPLAALDAAEVTFIDSAGLRFMLGWARAAALLGSPAVLRRASPPVERIVRRLGVDECFRRPS